MSDDEDVRAPLGGCRDDDLQRLSRAGLLAASGSKPRQRPDRRQVARARRAAAAGISAAQLVSEGRG